MPLARRIAAPVAIKRIRGRGGFRHGEATGQGDETDHGKDAA